MYNESFQGSLFIWSLSMGAIISESKSPHQFVSLMILSYYMIESYLASQMKKAAYETIDGGTRFYAEIKCLNGVWATGKNLEECRDQLKSVLEGWFILSLQKNLPLPNFKAPRIKMAKRIHA